MVKIDKWWIFLIHKQIEKIEHSKKISKTYISVNRDYRKKIKVS